MPQAWAAERGVLQPVAAPFDGFYESEHAVSGTCLISFDRNRYSVSAKAVRRTVQVRAYATRIVVRLGDEVLADHPRFFGRDRTIYDPWHYLPVLVTKPGALRNGAPFQDWELPPALSRLRRKLGAGDDADRRFVRVLAAVLDDGLDLVEAAVREALLPVSPATTSFSTSSPVGASRHDRWPSPHPRTWRCAIHLVPTAVATTACEVSMQRHEMMTPWPS